jgi:hypothetical protein
MSIKFVLERDRAFIVAERLCFVRRNRTERRDKNSDVQRHLPHPETPQGCGTLDFMRGSGEAWCGLSACQFDKTIEPKNVPPADG